MKKFHALFILFLSSVSLTSCIPGWFESESTEQIAEEPITRKPKHKSNIIYLHEQVTRFNSAQEAFRSLTKKGKVVVDFYAIWCPPCTRLSKTLEQVAPKYRNITFLKINTDQFKKLSSSIRTVPVLVFYENGIEIKRISGSKSPKELKDLLNSW